LKVLASVPDGTENPMADRILGEIDFVDGATGLSKQINDSGH
jgi:hypothetical protein